jgi:hypothetical protein
LSKLFKKKGTAQVMYNFGAFYKNRGDVENALLYFEKSYEIYNYVLGAEDQKTHNALENVTKLRLQLAK